MELKELEDIREKAEGILDYLEEAVKRGSDEVVAFVGKVGGKLQGLVHGVFKPLNADTSWFDERYNEIAKHGLPESPKDVDV